MMRSKILSIALGLMLVVTGCSSGASTTPDKGISNNASKDGAASSAKSDKPYAGKTLTVLYMSGTYADAAKLIAPEFEEKTGAKVTVVDAPYLELYEKEFSSLVSGGTYDVMSVAMQWDGQFAPYMEPLPKDLGVDYSQYIPAINKVTGEYNGVRFGIPMATDAYGVFYRKDLFDKAGIKADPKWTWDDYKKDAAALTKDGFAGTAITGQVDQMTGQVLPRFWAKGGHLFTKDWKPIPDKQLLVQSIQDIIDLMPDMPQGIMSYDIPTQSNAFVQGKVGMAEVWPSFARALASDAKNSKVTDTWGLLPYPSGGHSTISAWGLGVTKSSKNKELAQQWVKLYTSEEKQRLFLDKIGIGPTISKLYTDAEIVKKHSDFPNHLLSLEGALPPLRFPGAQEYTDFLDKQISAALSKQATPEQAVQNTIDKWNDLLKQNGAPEGEYTGDYTK